MKPNLRSLFAVTGIAISGWLVAGAGPVAAHEGTATTVPLGSATPAIALGEPTGEGILFGRAEYVPPPPAANEGNEWELLAMMVAGTGVITAGVAAAAVALRRRRSGAGMARTDRAQVAGAAALLFAAVAHVVLAPSHWAESWQLGAFFAASGVILAVQAGLLCLRPSRALSRSIVASTALMVLTYVAARQFALPLVDHRDPYLLADLPVKFAELFAANVALAFLLKTRETTPATDPPAVTSPLAASLA